MFKIFFFTEMPTEPEVPTQPGASDFTRPARTGQMAAKWLVAIARNEELRKERKTHEKICKKKERKKFFWC